MVASTGIEPVSGASETFKLYISQRGQEKEIPNVKSQMPG